MHPPGYLTGADNETILVLGAVVLVVIQPLAPHADSNRAQLVVNAKVVGVLWGNMGDIGATGREGQGVGGMEGTQGGRRRSGRQRGHGGGIRGTEVRLGGQRGHRRDRGDVCGSEAMLGEQWGHRRDGRGVGETLGGHWGQGGMKVLGDRGHVGGHRGDVEGMGGCLGGHQRCHCTLSMGPEPGAHKTLTHFTMGGFKTHPFPPSAAGDTSVAPLPLPWK